MPIADRRIAGAFGARRFDCCVIATVQIMWKLIVLLTCMAMVSLYVVTIETGHMANTGDTNANPRNHSDHFRTFRLLAWVPCCGTRRDLGGKLTSNQPANGHSRSHGNASHDRRNIHHMVNHEQRNRYPD